MMPRCFDSFVGLPWRDRGRTRDGLDCWGLVCLVYRELLGVILPSHADDYASTADRVALDGLIAGEREPWREVKAGTEIAGDVVLLRERPWHIGVVVCPGLMLHMPERQTSVMEPYTTGRHARRVEGLYRHVLRFPA